MTEQIAPAEQHRENIRDLLRRESANYRVIKLARHRHVYMSGDHDSTVYLIESGQVKLLAPSPDGRECVIAIYASGDFFGERCLSGQTIRSETAVTMRDTALRQIPARHFQNILRREPPLGALIQYLVERVAEKEDIITSLLTVKSEQRLAMTLLRLANRIGKHDPRCTRLDQRFSQEELAEMVGTTRSRVGFFLKRFREWGFIELSEKRHIIINRTLLREYLERTAVSDESRLESETRLDDSLPKPLVAFSNQRVPPTNSSQDPAKRPGTEWPA